MRTTSTDKRDDSRFLLGVLGGMGPAATADFYSKLIAASPAERDQDHVPVVIWADPTTPDRSAAILGEGMDPTPWLRRGAEMLSAAGSKLIVIPCNTAHRFAADALNGLGVRLIDMIEETVEELARMPLASREVGVLATDGTLSARLYQEALERRGFTCLLPDATEQQLVMDVIRAVKAGHGRGAASGVVQVANGLIERGAAAIVAGCTEIPLVLEDASVAVRVVDPVQVAIDRILEQFMRWNSDE